MDSLLQIFAIIVGIGQYSNTGLPRFDHPVTNAKNLARFLIHDLRVPEDHVKELYDGDATKDAILGAIAKIPENAKFKPGYALLFFFSGLAGRAGPDVGMICPSDIDPKARQAGISDSTLIRLFDQISRSYGNNIVSVISPFCSFAFETFSRQFFSTATPTFFIGTIPVLSLLSPRRMPPKPKAEDRLQSHLSTY